MVAGFLTGCADLARIAPPVTPGMVAVSGGVASATLETGRRIYTTQCTACHIADPVDKYSASEWRKIVADMSPRSKLSPEQEQALLAYIHAAPKTLPGS